MDVEKLKEDLKAEGFVISPLLGLDHDKSFVAKKNFYSWNDWEFLE